MSDFLDFLFGRKPLQKAAQQGANPAPPPQQPVQGYTQQAVADYMAKRKQRQQPDDDAAQTQQTGSVLRRLSKKPSPDAPAQR